MALFARDTSFRVQSIESCRANHGPMRTKATTGEAFRSRGKRLYRVVVCVCAVFLSAQMVFGSTHASDSVTAPGSLFAVDPDLLGRRVDPLAPRNIWTFGECWGLPPLFFRSNIQGLYQRADFLFPLGCREESLVRSKLRFTPLIESNWSKVPPFDGYSRCLTLFCGRSDMGQEYWGFFPFYGYSYRRRGKDSELFCLFPLYYQSTDDDIRTIRLLWPLITYSNSPGRFSMKIWPLFGKDAVRQDYFNWYLLWPFFQRVEKYPRTDQAYTYTALPFPLYMKQETAYSCSLDFIWPLITYYHHYATGHQRFTFRPLFTYGTGGGIDEISILYLYSYKRDRRKGIESGTGRGYVSVGEDDVFTEQKYMMISTIQKRYRKGCLIFARYRFWPVAEYTWDLEKGSHLKVPEIISLKNDFWDLNLGRFLRFVDLRDTPITRELSLLFGLSGHTEVKTWPHIPPPPKPGDDNWSELILGAFGKR